MMSGTDQLNRPPLNNAATEAADRKFFARRTDRNFRLRLASQAERVSLALGGSPTLRAGNEWYAVVRWDSPRTTTKFFGYQGGIDTDVNEATASALWRLVASEAPRLSQACAILYRGVAL